MALCPYNSTLSKTPGISSPDIPKCFHLESSESSSRGVKGRVEDKFMFLTSQAVPQSFHCKDASTVKFLFPQGQFIGCRGVQWTGNLPVRRLPM